jgi:hypothetical protein
MLQGWYNLVSTKYTRRRYVKHQKIQKERKKNQRILEESRNTKYIFGIIEVN